MDCFDIGRLSGTKGTVWQYSATDVFSAYTWAELRVTPKNPSARWTSALARWVAEELLLRGVRLERVMTDNASEFRAQRLQDTLRQLQVRHTRIHAGRPQTNGKAKRFIRTALHGWAFAELYRSNPERLAALPNWVDFYNHQRPHRAHRGLPPMAALAKKVVEDYT
jgi:transposase InsO family protein